MEVLYNTKMRKAEQPKKFQELSQDRMMKNHDFDKKKNVVENTNLQKELRQA